MVDPLYRSLHYMRLRDFDRCTEACKSVPTACQQEKWYIICRARTEANRTDFSEPGDTSAADLVFDESILAEIPRPGTSLRSAASGRGVRPQTKVGKMLTGYSHNQQNSTSSRAGAPQTSSTSMLSRLATASLAFSGDEPDVTSINVSKFARHPFLSRILVDYLLHRLHDPLRAVQLASECTLQHGFNDWWWKNRLGISYYLLGLFQEAEAQLTSSLSTFPSIESRLELAKLYSRIDQPSKAMSELSTGREKFPQEIRFILHQGRICEELGDTTKARELWRDALKLDQSCIEASASLGASMFYEDQPEISVRFYSYLRKLGIVNSAIFNNLAISLLASGNLTTVGNSLAAALTLADTAEEKSDVWYNISHAAIHAADLNLAEQCLLIATSINPQNGEAFNNLGLLELKKRNIQKSIAAFKSATAANPEMHEPWFNLALLYERLGQLQEAYSAASEAVRLYPGFTEAVDLLEGISQKLK